MEEWMLNALAAIAICVWLTVVRYYALRDNFKAYKTQTKNVGVNTTLATIRPFDGTGPATINTLDQATNTEWKFEEIYDTLAQQEQDLLEKFEQLKSRATMQKCIISMNEKLDFNLQRLHNDLSRMDELWSRDKLDLLGKMERCLRNVELINNALAAQTSRNTDKFTELKEDIGYYTSLVYSDIPRKIRETWLIRGPPHEVTRREEICDPPPGYSTDEQTSNGENPTGFQTTRL